MITCPQEGWKGDGGAEEKNEGGKNSAHAFPDEKFHSFCKISSCKNVKAGQSSFQENQCSIGRVVPRHVIIQ